MCSLLEAVPQELFPVHISPPHTVALQSHPENSVEGMDGASAVWDVAESASACAKGDPIASTGRGTESLQEARRQQLESALSQGIKHFRVGQLEQVYCYC